MLKPPPKKTEILAQSTPSSKLDYFKLLAEKVLQTATHSVDFKKLVYQECFAEYQDDYYITIRHLLSKNEELINSNEEFWNQEDVAYIEDILGNIQSIDEAAGENFTEPTIFVPFVEDINIDSLLSDCPSNTPEAVIAMEYEDETATCPGYTLNGSEELTANNNVEEEYAWTNDLWVFGQEEVFDDEGIEERAVSANQLTQSVVKNPRIGTNNNSAVQNRVNGRAE